MKIDLIHIDGFGKLVNMDWRPELGFNLIYGDNEAGKSTLLAFIRAMLYGLSPRRNQDLLQDSRRRYMPWDTRASYGGSLVLEVNGVKYRINRTFGKIKSQDVMQFMNEVTNTAISLAKDMEPGDYLFHMSEDEFANTVFVAQMQTVLGANDDISQKLVQLSSGTGPRVSPQEMLAELKKIRSNYQKNSDQSQDRILLRKIDAAKEALEQAREDELARIRVRLDIEGLDEALKENRELTEEVRRGQETASKERLQADLLKAQAFYKDAADIETGLLKLEQDLGEKPWLEQEEVSSIEQLFTKWQSLDDQLRLLKRRRDDLDKELSSYKALETLEAELNELEQINTRLDALETHERELLSAERDESDLFLAARQKMRDRLTELTYQNSTAKTELKRLENSRNEKEKSFKQSQDRLIEAQNSRLRSHEEELQRAFELVDIESKALEQKKKQIETQASRQAGRQTKLLSLKEEQRQIDSRYQDEAKELERLKATSKTVTPASKIAGMPYFLLGGILLIAALIALAFAIPTSNAPVIVVGAILAIVSLLVLLFANKKRQEPISETSPDLLLQMKAELLSEIESHQERLRASILEEQSDLDSITAELEENTLDLADLEKALQDAKEKTLTLKEQDESSLFADLLEEKKNLELKHAEDIRQVEVALNALQDTIEETSKDIANLGLEIEKMQFLRSDALSEKFQLAEKEGEALALALSKMELSDKKELGDKIDLLSKAESARRTLDTQLKEAIKDFEATEIQLKTIQEHLGTALEPHLHLSDLEDSQARFMKLKKTLSLHSEQTKTREMLLERAVQAAGGKSVDDIPKALSDIEAWFKANTKAVEAYHEFGEEALIDQAIDLEHMKQGLLEQRGSKQKTLELLEQNFVMPPDLEREITVLEEEYKALMFQVEAIDKASQLIRNSDEEMRRFFGPMIDEKTMQYLERLTGQTRSQLKVSNDFKVELSDEDSLLHEKDYFSEGKIDQMYLALRLAIGESIYDRDLTLPFFYDDVLVSYDTSRAKNTLDFLYEHCKEQDRQVFFVTCHEHIKAYVEEQFELDAYRLGIVEKDPLY